LETISTGSKKCIKCGGVFPATTGYFYKHDKTGLHPRCKQCHGGRFTHVIEDEKLLLANGFIKCHKCGEVKDLSSFYKRHSHKSYRKTCISCWKGGGYIWRNNNKEAINKKWHKDYRENIQMNLRSKLRKRIRQAMYMRGGAIEKSARTIDLVGCTYDFLQSYIESLFTDGMSWDLFMKSEIHIDHKRPCSWFDLSDPNEQKKCFHYTNLKPMWAFDNMSKSNRYAD